MLSIVESYVNKWLLTISYTKSFIMIVSLSKKFTNCNFHWTINSHPLEMKTKVTHVGIPVVSDMKSDSAIEVAVRKGRAAFHLSLGFSFRDQISLNPITSL